MLRETAEYPNSFVALGDGEERIDTGRYTLCMSFEPMANTVQRQRFSGEELDSVLVEVRAQLLARGRTMTQWEVGSAAEPHELVEMLLARGLEREADPVAVALALTTPPPPSPPGFTVRRIERVEDYLTAVALQDTAFGLPAQERALRADRARDRFVRGRMIHHAVWRDGRIVAAGTCAVTKAGLALFGGATDPPMRGRGAYRALIAARWEEAVALGRPALLAQAGSMSRPILERLGFEAVGRVEMLVDRFG